ncbi:MAG TPA: phage holin family protein [Polyangia bacterium]
MTKSAGKILNAIFGWSVRALFGRTSSAEQTFLSGLVAAAVAWPLLLAGVAAPRVAALVLAFVPIPHWIPAWSIRLVWLGLALIVPLALGIAITAKGPRALAGESIVKRLARGFPLTIGLATAFLIMFVSVPIMRLYALVRRRSSADVPLVTEGDVYHRVAVTMVEVLNRHGFALRPAQPGWWVSAPTRLLGWFGGEAIRKFVPAQLEHYESSQLTVSFYTSGVLLRGVARQVTWAHGLVAEAATATDGLQTLHTETQDLEKQIKQVWKTFAAAPAAHRRSSALLARIGAISQALGEIDAEFDEWQVLYRQVLQLDRAVRGEPQLYETVPSQQGDVVMSEKDAPTTAMSALPATESTELESESTAALIEGFAAQAAALAKKEIELAKTELRDDLKAEVAAVGRLGVAGLAAFMTVNLLLVTGVLVLARAMPVWGAGLLASGSTLLFSVIVGMAGWKKLTRAPLERTRRTLREDAQWTKERLA